MKALTSGALPLLVVDDDRVTRELLREVLEREGFSVQLASSGEEAIEAFKKRGFSVVLSDIRMIEISGMDVLHEAQRAPSQPAVILMTGFGSMQGAVEAIQQGAFDYISKPFKMDDLKALVARALKHWKTLRESPVVSSAPRAVEVGARGLIGRSPLMVEVYKTVARAAMSASNVLIGGESGTGKELVARAIHENSPRRARKFVAVNCGAIAENLLESELFGHVKGAFTGAGTDKKGLLDEAAGGTLFLDEIGDFPAPLQIKLLRVIQENEFRPVGSPEVRHADVRFIAATHRDLEALVRKGTFREDLYYRLKVIEIGLPALRERPEDLPDLIAYFLAYFSERNRKPVSHVSDEALEKLRAYPWPGNIRELEHSIERAVALSKTSVIFREDLPPEIVRGIARSEVMTALPDESLEQLERAHILKVLRETGFNKSKASEILGIDRATLYRKAQRYGIDLKNN